FNPPDWFPDEHPPMPEIVAIGRKPARACALCHLPTGDGHPESSSLAGLPVLYLVRQMAEFKNGGRKGVRANAMIDIAKAMSDTDVRAASEYFAGLKPGVWTKVVETATVPKTYVGSGAMRFAAPEGGTEPLYVVRQLNDMQNGNRTGSLAELMKAVVAKLGIEDMVAIAAYLGSLEP